MKVTQHIENANGKPLFSFEILPPLKGQNIQIPDNVVTPSLKAELIKQGVEISTRNKYFK